LYLSRLKNAIIGSVIPAVEISGKETGADI